MELDGFELGDSPSKDQFQNLNKKKNGQYLIEPVDKLKEKGYNLFKEVTTGTGDSGSSRVGSLPRSILLVDEQTRKKAKKSTFYQEFAA